MRKSTCTEEQIAYALRQAESGIPITEGWRKLGISEQTFSRWKRTFAGMGIAGWGSRDGDRGMGIAGWRRLRRLEEENHRLKQLVADLTVDRPWIARGSPVDRPWIALCCRRSSAKSGKAGPEAAPGGGRSGRLPHE